MLRDYLMPNHGFKMAENGTQELEVFDTSEHKSGYAYIPAIAACAAVRLSGLFTPLNGLEKECRT